MKKRILFVDDEPNVLAGMMRMLRSLRNKLDISFTESGKEALHLMDDKPFDIIISDMRMPGMDGAELLTRVSEKYPETIRIVLTGQAGEDMVLRTVNVAHQFLTKPCEPDRLKMVIYRACLLHNILTSQQLRKVVSQITTLPSLPTIYRKIQGLLANPDSSVDDVAECIAQDMSMSAKILQLVNSAFFALYQNIESPQQAVHLLGLDTVKALALTVQIFSRYKETGISALFMERLWQHSLTVGAFSRKIAGEETADKETINNSFVAGLQHDIGKLIFAVNFPEKYALVVDKAVKQHTELFAAEQEEFQAGHAEIGAYLLGLWGFNSAVIEAIAYHHHPDSYPDPSFAPLTAVHAANVLANELYGPVIGEKKPSFNAEYLLKTGYASRIEGWRRLCAATGEEK